LNLSSTWGCFLNSLFWAPATLMPSYLLETNYYSSAWVWIKRLAIWLAALFILLVWDFSDMPPYGKFAVYLGFILFSAILLLSPVDDLAVDGKYFYYIRTSFLHVFSRTTRYEISTLNSIRCVGVHAPGITIGEMTTRRYQGGYTNTIEMSFIDGSYKSLEVGVYKQELIEILQKVHELMPAKPKPNKNN
jgi:hypothetical protein